MKCFLFWDHLHFVFSKRKDCARRLRNELSSSEPMHIPPKREVWKILGSKVPLGGDILPIASMYGIYSYIYHSFPLKTTKCR